MNILYLAPSTIPSRSANSVHVMKMCQAFSRLGHEVTLIGKEARGEYTGYDAHRIFDFYGITDTFKLQLIKVPVKRGAESEMSAKTYFLLRKVSSERTIVYARFLYGAILASLMGFRVIYETHEFPRNSLRLALERWSYCRRGFLKVVVISEALKRIYRNGVVRNSGAVAIQVAHDAADLPKYSPRDYTPRLQNRGKGCLHLGYMGHLYQGRGLDVILGMARQTPECFYHILGGNEPEVCYWRKRQPANVFFYGYVEPRLVKYYMREMDVLLMPYQKTVHIDAGATDTASWMSPMKMCEYMAAQKPIISSDLPVLREVLSNRVNALMVEPDNVKKWVEAVDEMKSRSFRDRLAHQAFLDLERYYTWDKRVCGILDSLAP